MRKPPSKGSLKLFTGGPKRSHPHNREISSRVMIGDCRRRLAFLPGGSVDAIITDPPYGVTDLAYDQDALDPASMWELFDRIAKPSAVVVVFTCQPFTTAVINARPKAFRYELIWHKNTVTGFLDAKRKPLRAHENILVFCRSVRAATYNPQMEVGKPYKQMGGGAALYHNCHRVMHVNKGTRYPRTVQFVKSVSKGRLHPSEKPLELLRWLVATYSNASDLICDPFMGSASCGQAALDLGRRFIGVERDATFFKRACDRLRKTPNAQPRRAA
jgi:site-specific DNA-methyltransferase (adenine-specific)